MRSWIKLKKWMQKTNMQTDHHTSEKMLLQILVVKRYVVQGTAKALPKIPSGALQRWLCAFMDKTEKWMQKTNMQTDHHTSENVAANLSKRYVVQGTAKALPKIPSGALQRWLCAFMDKTEKWMQNTKMQIYGLKDVTNLEVKKI